jgi:hypothetical protein
MIYLCAGEDDEGEEEEEEAPKVCLTPISRSA